MHDLNKSIRVNNATRQPQPGMGYGPHGGARGNPEDPVAAAQGGGGGYVRLPPNSMSSLPKQVQQQQGRPGYPHDDYMHPHHAAAAAAAAHAYYGGEQGPPPPPPPPPPSMPPLPPRQGPPQAAEGAVSAAAHASAVQQGRDSIRFSKPFQLGVQCLRDAIKMAHILPLCCIDLLHILSSKQVFRECLPYALMSRFSVGTAIGNNIELRPSQIACKKNLQKMMGVSPSDIDKYSRIFFPVTFTSFNLMYWIIYLHVSDEVAEDLVLLHPGG